MHNVTRFFFYKVFFFLIIIIFPPKLMMAELNCQLNKVGAEVVRLENCEDIGHVLLRDLVEAVVCEFSA